MDRDRDPLVDALRAAALLIVVVGHFMMAGVWWEGGDLNVINVLKLDRAEWAHWLTWVLQPMPVLFAVGAWANATSWSRLVAEGEPTDRWLTSRVRRLCVPAATFILTVTAVVAVVEPLAPGMGGMLASRLAMPLWFLALYLPLTAATPTMVGLAERHGWRAFWLMAAAILAVDGVRAGLGVGWVGWLNLALVWLTVAQAGTTAAVASLPSSRMASTVAIGSLLALLALVTVVGAYPVSMIGIGTPSNTLPPTAALALLGGMHLAGLAWAAVPLRAFAARRRVRRAVQVFGAAGIHVYLWHLTALVALIGLQRLGLFDVEPLSTSWWLSRAVVIPFLLLLALAMAVAVGQLDLRRLRASEPSVGHGRGVAASMLGAVGIGAVTVEGLRAAPVPLAGAVAVAAATRLAIAGRPGDDAGSPGPVRPAPDRQREDTSGQP